MPDKDKNARAHLSARTQQFVDRFAEALFRRERRLDLPAFPGAHDEARRSILQRLVSIVASLAVLAAFIFAVAYFSSTTRRMAENPLVVNLAKQPLMAHVAFGASPRCGDAECWTNMGFDDRDWTTVSLPLDPDHNITSLPGYEQGLTAGVMYYRFNVAIPPPLADRDDEISLALVYIQHQSYRIFLNGRLVSTGNGIGLGQFANISIPKEDIHRGQVEFVIRASVTKDDAGIATYTPLLLGPKRLLDSTYIHFERANITYPILFVLSKGSIFIIFALFFLYTKGQRGLFKFLIYAFSVTTENLYESQFFFADYMDVRVRVLCYFLTQTIAVIALAGFFLDYFQVIKHRRPYYIASTVMVALVLALTFDFGWGSRTVTYKMLWGLVNAYLVSTIVVALAIGILAIHLWRKVGADAERIRAFKGFVSFLSVYLTLLVWEFYFNTYLGFDKRAVFDLFFFYYLALVTAKDFGFKEGRIVSLESHMVEKRRMEAELQEAAEIARAFIPATLPVWPSYAMDSFHRSLTEASGDWFAFESATGRQLYHFIMCDITGHGVQAAIVVSTCKAILSSLVRSSPDLLEQDDFVTHYMSNLNATLWANGQGVHVSTLLGLTLDPANRRLHYVTAGHPAPVVLRRADPTKPQVLTSRNPLLGIGPTYAAQMKTTDLNPGDQLIAYTDGMPLTANVRALQRFIRDLHPHPTPGTSQALFKAICEADERRSHQATLDDVSIVWFEAVA